MEVKVDKRGKITIPKKLRDKYNLQPGIVIKITDYDPNLMIKPMYTCPTCKKALPKELYERGSCLECPPPKRITIY